jgi:phospholipid/cholesterol/gamma-HCH transport system substrate-binding protein
MISVERFFSPPEIGAPGRRAGQRQRRDLLISGLFVLAMLAVLAAALLIVSGYFVGTYSLTTDFSEAGGLEPGTPVRQADYVIGTIAAIEPVFSNEKLVPRFKVVMRIQKGWKIPEDSIAVIGSAGLLQGNVVKVVPGSSTVPLNEGESIRSGKKEPDLSQQLAELTDRLSELMRDSVTPLVASVKRQIEALEGLMLTGEDDVGSSQQTIAGILENLRDVSATLKAQMEAIKPKELGALVDSARTIARNVEQITDRLNSRSREIESTVKNFSELADRLNKLVEKNDPAIERSLADTQVMLQEMSTAVTPILSNLDEITQNLLQLSQDLRNDPALVLWGRKLPDNAPQARP